MQVCIKVFRDNGDVRYDCLDVSYPGTEVDGSVCFQRYALTFLNRPALTGDVS